ncbi:MAG: polysaccharide biosynthesis/export family protein, partial [Pseudomonadota bacterium]
MRLFIALGISVVLVILSGCSTPVSRPPEESARPDGRELTNADGERVGPTDGERKARLDALMSPSDKEFLLGRGDVLAVAVYNEPDLQADGLAVRPDGRISFPLVGDVQAAGVSVEALRTNLTKRLSEFVHEPKVSVVVQRVVSHEYTLVGEVVKPGVYPLDRTVT